MNQPLMVSYGGGVDSSAILVEMARRMIRPDLVIFANVGAEKPETIAYLDTMDAWLRHVGFPTITRVRRYDVVKPRATTRYRTIAGEMIANETLPALAFNQHSCSIKWKAEPIGRWMRTWQPAVDAWAAGHKVRRVIGYDCSTADTKRARRAPSADDQYENWYPLIDWKMDREACQRSIAAAGLPVPIKSACYFCPASKPAELDWLRETHPDLFQRALQMEAQYQTGKHGRKGGRVRGLWRGHTWGEWAQRTPLTVAGVEVRRRKDGGS